MTNTEALATEAINAEGVAAYFPEGTDYDEAIDTLADYLAANPDRWTPGTDESAWVASFTADDLAAWASAQ